MKTLYILLTFLLGLQHKPHQQPTSSIKKATLDCDEKHWYKTPADRKLIILTINAEDTLSVTKAELKHILLAFPELNTKSQLMSPQKTFAHAGKHAKISPCFGYNYGTGCELCIDMYCACYAYFLKQKNGNNTKRQQLTKLYNAINSLYSLTHGGNGWGHIYRRIPAQVEYAIYEEKNISTINKQTVKAKSLYLKQLKKRALNDTKEWRDDLFDEQQASYNSQLNQTLTLVDGLIINDYYMSKAEEFARQFIH